MKILFLCKANVFRSQMAEGFFNKYSKGNPGIAKSAALVQHSVLDSKVNKIMKDEGIDISKKKSKNITKKLVKESDLIVIVNPNLLPYFEKFKKDMKKNSKLEVWNIKDATSATSDADWNRKFKIGKEKVKKKVLDLIKRLDRK
jgi:protein-tyrosine-phosphatase